VRWAGAKDKKRPDSANSWIGEARELRFEFLQIGLFFERINNIGMLTK